MSVSTEETSRAGVLAVGATFTRMRWAFREQPISDYGVDAQVEKIDADGSGSGRLVGLQIKSGTSYFKKLDSDFVYYGTARHREYWTNHCLPIFVILHNPENGQTLWQKVESHLIREGKDGAWSIVVPTANTLDEEHDQYFLEGVAPDSVSLRRHRLALDLSLIQQFSEQDDIYLRLEEWQNKTLNFRGVEVVFNGDPEAEADLEWGWCFPARGVGEFMAELLPWLTYSDHQWEECGGGEVVVHTIRGELSAIGKAALLLEDYYQEGVEQQDFDDIINPDWLDHEADLSAADDSTLSGDET